MSDEPEPGGPELISLRELARRLGMSHQRVSQLSRSDPAFPPLIPVGRSKAVDWKQAEPYFLNRTSRQGERTDIKTKQAEQPPGEENGT
jgi:predicted DNA-binding transcriptional regulator AlpA